MLIDYHLHNRFSPDSNEATSAILNEAQKKGVQEVCITNHVELHDNQSGLSIFDSEEAESRFQKIQEDISETQKEFPNIPIKFGAELEYVEGRMNEIADFVEKTPFDFILGSVHIVKGVIIASHLFADELYEKTDEETAYNEYFETLKKLVEWGHFDAVAHFDICKKNGTKFYGAFQPEKYKSKIMEVLEIMTKKKIGIELNTKCIDNKCCEIFPHPQILKWALEAGIKNFTMSSDAHKAEHVSLHLKSALETAKEVGITEISTYTKRQPTRYKL